MLGYKRKPSTTRSNSAGWIALLATSSVLAPLATLSAQTLPIAFAATVPPAPAEMQVYKLAPTAAPLEFLNEKLAALKLPALKLERNTYVARGTTGQSDQDRVRAFADSVSGDVHYIPNLAELARPAVKANELSVDRARTVARSLLNDTRFIPKDATELRIIEPIPVMGSTTEHPRAGAPPAFRRVSSSPRVVMNIVPAVRYASGLQVFGRGSHALVTLANDESVVGALRRWRMASPGETIHPGDSAERVRADVERQLRPLVGTHGARATVDKIVLAYYDGNANYLQPVYRFEATVRPDADQTPAGKRISNIKVAGYVPIGKLFEPIPDLAAKPSGATPSTPKRPDPSASRTQITDAEPAPKTAQDDISLGEYVNQDWPNDSGYVSMADSFLNGLTFLNTIYPGATPPVARTQWYVAYPWEVVGPSSKYFLNAVNVAYTVPHGNWLINTTLSNCCDTWYVPDIGTGGNPGFGAAAGGVLATWIIMSCEVIPSYYDRANQATGTLDGGIAFQAWWPVFQGLHNVIGFRTVMFYPDDDLQFGFGYDVSLGGDINAAWFQEVAANDGDDGTYADTNLRGSPQVHYDRASTMIDGRDLGQSIYSVGAQTASTTLWNFWMGN
jgi:hypothetical protein